MCILVKMKIGIGFLLESNHGTRDRELDVLTIL
jgi:hypothetical protein